ncbi:MAG: leucine-rich repeat protein [Oscillospiraceae bacterium]|nr:leucine-rich repeat protein [Oscillospiraceae bacterium]
MRKYISVYFLIFCMLTAAITNNVYAADTLVTEYSDGTFTYELYQSDDGNAYAAVTHCSSSESTVTVPDSVVSEGITYKVSKIDSYSFSKASSASVILPVSVEIIADKAFYECTALRNIQIPESIISIGNWSFGGCTSLESISVSGENISIGEWAFCDCTVLASVDLQGVVSLGTDAFNGCSGLTTVSLSADIKSIAAEAFFGCYNLTDIWYNGTQSEWNAVEIGADNEYLEKANVHFAGAVQTGDINGDDNIDISDAAAGLTIYANMAAGLEITNYTENKIKAADVNGDGEITIIDMTYVLTYYAQTAAGIDTSWDMILGR